MVKQRIGIVGGGIMGMSLASQLASPDHEITLIEASNEIGGLVGSARFGDYEWDRFYHVILLSDLRTRNLLRDLHLEHKIKWKETKTGFFTNGKLYSMSNTMEFLKFPPLNLLDKFRLGLTILVASRIKNPARLEKIRVTDWLRKWSGNRTYTRIWLPLLRAKLGEGYKKTSASFIWATIQRLYGARKSGLKKEMFGFIDGGYAIVIDAFKSLLLYKNVSIRTNHKVVQIYQGISEKIVVEYKNGLLEDFDRVIVTLPSDMAASVCKGISDEEAFRLKQIEYLGVICVSLLLEKPISPFYVTNITETWLPFTGVIEMTSLVDKDHFGGLSLIYLPKYLSQDDPLMKAGDDEISTYFVDSLKKMVPWLTNDHIKHVSVSRAGKVIALPTLNYADKIPSVKTSIPGLYIINSSMITDGTLNVNETLKVAESKIKEVLYI